MIKLLDRFAASPSRETAQRVVDYAYKHPFSIVTLDARGADDSADCVGLPERQVNPPQS